jgi:hypothetical protein
MSPRLAQQLEQVQNELTRKLAEAEGIGDCLVELGIRLQQEPWNWSLGWLEDAFPSPNSISPVEAEMAFGRYPHPQAARGRIEKTRRRLTFPRFASALLLIPVIFLS